MKKNELERKLKIKPQSYCEYVSGLEKGNLHRIYHDIAYGFYIYDDNALFGRLVLEINQAGLSWTTILNKQKNFEEAFHKFNIKKIASYTAKDRMRLLNNAGIIRNRLKIDAVIHNAKIIMNIKKDFGSFRRWLQYHHLKEKDEWVKLFKITFKFTGGEIVGEFLMSIGYLPGAHVKTCPIYKTILRKNNK